MAWKSLGAAALTHHKLPSWGWLMVSTSASSQVRNSFGIQRGYTKSVGQTWLSLIVEFNFLLGQQLQQTEMSPQKVADNTCSVFGLLCDILNEGVEPIFTRSQILTHPLKSPQVLLHNTQIPQKYRYVNFKISFLASGLVLSLSWMVGFLHLS